MKRSNLAGWAGYGCCASRSRFFYGLRLHPVCTPTGLPITFANPKADERDVAPDMFDRDPSLFNGRDIQTMIADKGYASREFETRLAERGIQLVRPALTGEQKRPGANYRPDPLDFLIELVAATLIRPQPRPKCQWTAKVNGRTTITRWSPRK